MRDSDRERRQNLLAALNDGPEGLTGWKDAPTIVNTIMGPIEVPGLKYRRLDQMWFTVGVARTVKEVTETLGGIHRMLNPEMAPGSRFRKRNK